MEPKNLHIRGTIQIPGTDTHIPRLGLGVYKIRDDTCTQACLIAINCGYRSIDSAQLYRNEAHVGAAVAQSSLPRDQLFITTKISRAQATEDDTHSKLLESVEKIGGSQGYVDLFLIHVPGSDIAKRKRLWASLEKLHAQGKAKTIGVSNFHISHIEEMREYAKIWPPHVNQIELHPWCQQKELVNYCRDNGIVVQAYSPLATGVRLQDPTLGRVASKHDKSPAQILIRYSLQKDWVTLPKSQNPERIRENANVFDFTLDSTDMHALDGLDLGRDGALFLANAS